MSHGRIRTRARRFYTHVFQKCNQLVFHARDEVVITRVLVFVDFKNFAHVFRELITRPQTAYWLFRLSKNAKCARNKRAKDKTKAKPTLWKTFHHDASWKRRFYEKIPVQYNNKSKQKTLLHDKHHLLAWSRLWCSQCQGPKRTSCEKSARCLSFGKLFSNEEHTTTISLIFVELNPTSRTIEKDTAGQRLWHWELLVDDITINQGHYNFKFSIFFKHTHLYSISLLSILITSIQSYQ